MALTGERKLIHNDGVSYEIPLAANAVIYTNALVVRDSSGNARARVATAGDSFAGVAQACADNTGGSAGDVEVLIDRGYAYWLPTTDLTAASIGKTAYLVDDEKVCGYNAAPGSVNIPVGLVLDYSASRGVHVACNGAENVSAGMDLNLDDITCDTVVCTTSMTINSVAVATATDINGVNKQCSFSISADGGSTDISAAGANAKIKFRAAGTGQFTEITIVDPSTPALNTPTLICDAIAQLLTDAGMLVGLEYVYGRYVAYTYNQGGSWQVEVQAGSSNDLAVRLKLGLANGGIERAASDSRNDETIDSLVTALVSGQVYVDACDADQIACDADAVATAADAVSTGADAIATAADAVATAADRVQTGLDAVATAADAVSTGGDAIATAADRVQTGLDAVATAADRVQTGLDAVATAADRVQTGLDAVATAADVVTCTGLAAKLSSFSADLNSTPPSQTQLVTNLGAAALGKVGVYEDTDGALYVCFSGATNWYYLAGTIGA